VSPPPAAGEEEDAALEVEKVEKEGKEEEAAEDVESSEEVANVDLGGGVAIPVLEPGGVVLCIFKET